MTSKMRLQDAREMITTYAANLDRCLDQLAIVADTDAWKSKCRSELERAQRWLAQSDSSDETTANRLCPGCTPYVWECGPIDHEPTCTAVKVTATREPSPAETEGKRELSATEAASFDKAFSRSPRRVDETTGFKAPRGVGPEPSDGSAGTTPAPNWRSIGSEPRDVPLLCYWAPRVPRGPYAIGDAVHSSIGDGWHRPGYITEELNIPTYWMPMPVVLPGSALKASARIEKQDPIV